MKTKLLFTALFTFSFFLSSCFAQIPQGFNYQAIARDGSGNPIVNASLPVRLTVQSDSAGSNVIWQELFSSVTTNSFGLFTLVMGRGARQSGTAAVFDSINWSTTPIFLKTEVNYSGWKTMGTTRLWSVPYAIRAKDTETKQTLSLAGNDLSISEGNTVTLPAGSSPWVVNGSAIYTYAANIGIGTETPLSRLNVAENANTDITYPLYIQNASGDWTATEKGVGLKFGRIDPTSGHDYGTIRGTIASGSGAMGRLQFIGGAGNTPHMTIDYQGNVGIGTVTPNALLDVNTSSNYHFGAFYSTAGATSIGAFNDGFSAWQSLSINPGGQVWFLGGAIGIGTANPAKRLHIHSTTADAHLYVSGTAPSMEFGNNETFGSSPMYGLFALATANGNYGINAGDVILGAYGNSRGNIYINSNYSGTGTTNIIMQPSAGNVGIGTTAPTSKMVIQPPATWDDNTPLFEVKNKSGVSVFSVYNNGVRVFVQTNSGKGVKGGFAIGGFDPTKAGNVDLMSVSPDSIRFNIDNGTSKAAKGGFAIGSFDNTKGINQNFMYITPQNSGNGQYNNFLGYLSGHSNTSGFKNTFIGDYSGYSSTLGANNQCIGSSSGYSITNGAANILIGTSAGSNITTGDYNIMIGNYAGVGATNDDSYNIVIGNMGGYYGPLGNQKLYIDCNPTPSPLIWGDFLNRHIVINGNAANNPWSYTFCVNGTAGGNAGWNVPSDSRLKKDITTIDEALNKVLQLRGVYFNWNDSTKANKQQMGFIAQEAVGTIPQVVNKSNGYYSMDYAPVTALLVEAMKEQQKQIKGQKQQIESQNEKIARLEKMVEEMQCVMAKSGVK